MTTSINSVTGRGSGNFDPSDMASKMASRMMKDLDPNDTGSVSKDQFVSKLSDKGVSSTEATAMIDSIDTKKSGSITKADIESSIKSGSLKPPAGGPPGGAKGPRGAGGPGGGAGASTSSQSYDAADTDKDGVVSSLEAAIYAISHPSASNTDSTKTDPSKLGQNVDQLV